MTSAAVIAGMVVQKTPQGTNERGSLSLPSIIECWPQKIGEALIKINA